MAPETPLWLNPHFVEKVLRESEGDNSIHVTDVFSKAATNAGDNYTSDMHRVTIEYTRDRGGRKIAEKRAIIFKVSFMEDSLKKELVEQARIFDTEILMMSDTLDKMNKMLRPEHRLSGKCLYTQTENPALLVIEDLAPLGFQMADREAGLDLAHCKLALRGLGRFHATSVAVCEKEPNQKQLYQRGMFSTQHPPEMKGFFLKATKFLGAEVEKWPELGKKYADKIYKLVDSIYQVGIKASMCYDDEFNVINHGDFWVNNMMFKYNEDGKPTDHIFVDFQICSYTSPAIDLHYFLNTSPSLEVSENHTDDLLNEYLTTLSTTMKQLGCKTQPPTMKKLKETLKRRVSYGMIASFTVLPLVLCEKNNVKDLNEIMSDDTEHHPAYSSKYYRKIMTKRIPMYDEMGLLDA